jgi:hypothetical protein
MALGGTSNQTGKLFILKFTTKDKDKKNCPAHFSVLEKGSDGKYNQVDTVTRVSGNLFKVDVKDAEWQGDKYKVISLYLKDGEEAYLLDFRMTLPARSLFNSLLSLERYDGLAITAYDGKNGYPAIGLWQDDKMVKWKYKLDELPAPETVKFKGKEMNDYTKVDDFFAGELQTLAAKLGGNKRQAQAKPAPAEATDDTPPEPNF